MDDKPTSKQFDIVCYLIDNQLNIKYFYASQILAMIEIVSKVFSLDLNKQEDLILAIDSAKKAVEIYFVHEEDDIENAILSDSLEWWKQLSPDSFEVSTWNNKLLIRWKGEELPRGIIFHVSRRLTFMDEI